MLENIRLVRSVRYASLAGERGFVKVIRLWVMISPGYVILFGLSINIQCASPGRDANFLPAGNSLEPAPTTRSLMLLALGRWDGSEERQAEGPIHIFYRANYPCLKIFEH